jgi:alginate O-acetyltransferase complex protein AlgJ
MPLLVPGRRFQGIAVVAILVLVMIGGLLPDPFVTPSPVKPPKPANTGTLGRLVATVDEVSSYFAANMNYAASAPLLRGIVEYELGASSSAYVYVGRNRHLFYAGESAAAQSAGAIYRRPETLHFVDMATILNRELQRRGATFIVAIPPNAQSIAIGDLPSWSRPRPPFEYDLAIGELMRQGIATVDLKRSLLAMKNSDALYRLTDTHWSTQGAAVAFNLVVSGAGHPEWRVDLADVLGPIMPIAGGDLAHFMGIQRYLTDAEAPILPAPEGGWEKLDILRAPPFAGVFDAYAYSRKGAEGGERVLILGDSFTRYAWVPLFQRGDLGRIGWMHHGVCGFDYADVERFDPTLVILAPTERTMPCAPAAWPSGLPRQ